MKEFESSREADRYILRFERPGHRDELKVQAAQQKRSMNKQILILIEAGQAALAQEKGAKQ